MPLSLERAARTPLCLKLGLSSLGLLFVAPWNRICAQFWWWWTDRCFAGFFRIAKTHPSLFLFASPIFCRKKSWSYFAAWPWDRSSCGGPAASWASGEKRTTRTSTTPREPRKAKKKVRKSLGRKFEKMGTSCSRAGAWQEFIKTPVQSTLVRNDASQVKDLEIYSLAYPSSSKNVVRFVRPS